MTSAIPILLYHSIGTASSPGFRRWVVAPDLFDRQVSCIREEGYTPLTVSELVDAIRMGNVPDRPVAITFDDGFRDFHTHAAPILTRYRISSTLYVCTGYVGATSRWLANQGEGGRPMLSWNEVRELHDAGVEIGAHTRTHPQLDTLQPRLARAEIEGSRRDLEDCIGRPVRSFAYPHGYHGRIVRQLVRQAGYDSACAVKGAVSNPSDDHYALARVIVNWDTAVETLRLWLRGEGVPSVHGGERFQTRGWRVVRRARARLSSPRKGD